MNSADPYPVLCLLQSHLEGRLRQGETRLWLRAEAAEALREIVRMRPKPGPVMAAPGSGSVPAAGKQAVQVSGPAAGSAADSAPVKPAAASDGERKAEAPAGGGGERLPAAGPVKVSLPPQDPAADGPLTALPRAAGGGQEEEGTELPDLAEKEERLAAVRARAEEGRAARALGTLRDQMVFAVGSAGAEIVFVGEAPGAEEERQREPFVGPAGQLLTRVLKTMGLERSGVYITNICKFRPAMESQGSRNRAPSEEEMDTCLEFVREEIRIIRPRVIVALGGTAITGLLGLRGGVTRLRGQFHRFEGIPVMTTFHPSYLLHREKDGPAVSMAEKRKFWEDMMLVMEQAGMEVTERHRGFFLPKE